MQTFLNTLTNKFAVFKGRATRREFWFFQFGLYGVVAGLILIGRFTSVWITPFFALFILLMLLPSVSVATRRLHDSGKSGWFQLVMVIPILGTIIFLVHMCLKGDPGGNRYGDPASNDATKKITLESAKEILVRFAGLAVFFLLCTLVPRLIYPTVYVSVATEVAGQVTGSEQNRGYYKQHLNRESRKSFDFNCFEAIPPLPEGILPKDVSVFKLGGYLRSGDEVNKAANSPVLSVHRGKQKTQWQCLETQK